MHCCVCKSTPLGCTDTKVPKSAVVLVNSPSVLCDLQLGRALAGLRLARRPLLLLPQVCSMSLPAPHANCQSTLRYKRWRGHSALNAAIAPQMCNYAIWLVKIMTLAAYVCHTAYHRSTRRAVVPAGIMQSSGAVGSAGVRLVHVTLHRAVTPARRQCRRRGGRQRGCQCCSEQGARGRKRSVPGRRKCCRSGCVLGP